VALASEEQGSLPGWARTLQRRLRQRGINAFILHGPGVRDIHPLGARRHGTIAEFLSELIFSDRAVVIFYDRGSGIRFTDSGAEQDFRTVLKAYDKVGGTNFANTQPRDPDRALQLLETYLQYQLKENPRFSAAIIIDFAETVAPAGDPGQLPVEDRNATVTLRRWSADPLFLQRLVTFCLIAESTSVLNESLVADARTFELQVPVPDERERHAYLTARGVTPQMFARIDARKVAVLTSGLTRLHLESLLAEAEAGGAELDPTALTREKKRLIEESSGGLLSFLTSTIGLDSVAGHDGAKTLLRQTAAALRQGRLDVVPMGFLICGPVGTGKSFIVRCFAAEIGIPVVELLNFRSMWQGQTEANLERILGLLDALGPVAAVVDEADAALGNRERGGGDSGVSERVFGALAAFMGDTRRRGKVIWFLMTSRPDLVPVDLKRQGRAEEHIALFPPSTAAERVQVFESLRTRLNIPLEQGVQAAALFQNVPHPMSAADIEAVLVRASRRMAIEQKPALSAALLQDLISDFQPPGYPVEIEYQRLIAALECTSRQLLPPDLAELPQASIAERLRELRATMS
jgi:AAA+ superfamily predicted ATPase